MANGNVPNLRFQGQAPFASIVDAIRQKPVLEEQIRASQGQQENQRFQSILQAAQQGIQLASFATQQSQQRQRQSQLEELGASLQQSLAPELQQAQQQLQQTQPTPAIGPPTLQRQQAQAGVEQIQNRQQQIGQLAGLGQVKAAQDLTRGPKELEVITPRLRNFARKQGLPVGPDTTLKELEEFRKLKPEVANTSKNAQTFLAFNTDTQREEVVTLKSGESLPANLLRSATFKNAPTEVQGKAAAFTSSMASASVTLDTLEKLAKAGKTGGFDPTKLTDDFNIFLSENANLEDISPKLGGFRRSLGSPLAQIYYDAMLEFVLADTRKVSGAAIKSEEIVQAFQQFITSGGDTPAAVVAKRQRRGTRIDAFATEANSGLRPDRKLVNLDQLRTTAKKNLRAVFKEIKGGQTLLIETDKGMRKFKVKGRRKVKR